jgi:hypothetical protein
MCVAIHVDKCASQDIRKGFICWVTVSEGSVRDRPVSAGFWSGENESNCSFRLPSGGRLLDSASRSVTYAVQFPCQISWSHCTSASRRSGCNFLDSLKFLNSYTSYSLFLPLPLLALPYSALKHLLINFVLGNSLDLNFIGISCLVRITWHNMPSC